MFRPQSLALYKNRPALVLEIKDRDPKDRIEIRLEDGSSLRVRDKDLALLHEGPVKELPQGVSNGDFETARRMLAPGASLPWSDLAELVFGDSGPAQVLACWQEANLGLLFKIEDGRPLPLDDETVTREAQKKARKEGEAAERAAFVVRARKIRADRRKAGPGPDERPRSRDGLRGFRWSIPLRDRGSRLRQERKEQDLRRSRHRRDSRVGPNLPPCGGRLGRDGQSPSLPLPMPSFRAQARDRGRIRRPGAHRPDGHGILGDRQCLVQGSGRRDRLGRLLDLGARRRSRFGDPSRFRG